MNQLAAATIALARTRTPVLGVASLGSVKMTKNDPCRHGEVGGGEIGARLDTLRHGEVC